MAEIAPVCVVCGSMIDPMRGAPLYANAYEKVRRKAPCCTPACAAQYNPDLHWLPLTWPDLLDATGQERRLPTFRNRLIGGELPRTVIREALFAGLSAAALRSALLEVTEARERAADADDRRMTTRWWLFGIFTSRREPMRPFDPARVREALEDLDRWEAARR